MTAKGATRRTTPWMQGLALGLGLALMPGLVVLGTTLLLPCLAVRLLETTRNRQIANAMLLFAGAVAVKPLIATASAGGSLQAGLAVADPWVVLLAWLAAGTAWCLFEASNVLVAMSRRTAMHRRRVALGEELAAIRAEWRDLAPSRLDAG